VVLAGCKEARLRRKGIGMLERFARSGSRRVFAAAALVMLASATALAQDVPDAGAPVPSDAGALPAETVETAGAPPPPAPPAPPGPPPTIAPESAPASEEPPADTHVYETVVRGRRPMTAASSLTVRDRDLLLRPHPRPADILHVTPGLFVVQHAGGGKANQYFLRGFDADHGSDVALFVDGVPVNMVSHGHGQGYADLHWLIPEVVERVEVYKGPYFAEYGDFATAGAINLVTRRSFELSQVSLGGGMFNTYRGLVVASPHLEGWRPFIAAEVYGTDGPFENGEDLKRFNLFGRVTREIDTRSSFSLTLTSYGGGWNASGQVPLREVEAARLDRFGSIDPTEGGNSQRHSVYATYRALPADDSEFLLTAYLAHYRLALFSNFTFFSRDPVNGDMIEQNDVRTLMGLRSSYRFLRRAGGIAFDTTFGAQLRNDLISNALHYNHERERLSTIVDADVREGSLAVWGQEDVTWTRWLRSVVGLRADYFGFDVSDNLEDTSTTGTRTSGVRDAAFVSPKASLILSPLRELDFYLNFGMGFHSNDARGVVRGVDPVTPLTRAIGGEIGARTRLFDRLDLAAAFFVLDLESEIVWVGDEGVTEARGPTRRLGGEFELRLKILPWLFADGDVTVSRATFTENPGNANAVALAPTLVVSGGVSARHPDGYFGRLGVFAIGDRPATEDRFLTAEGFWRVDATLGYRYKDLLELAVTGQNLFNVAWREAQFANVSRLPSETSPSSCPAGTRPVEDGGTFLGCEDVHFTPGAPINVQATATLFF
jgi:outer membrane receptor protein involved in Fe transport